MKKLRYVIIGLVVIVFLFVVIALKEYYSFSKEIKKFNYYTCEAISGAQKYTLIVYNSSFYNFLKKFKYHDSMGINMYFESLR